MCYCATSVAVICTDNPLIDPFINIVPLEGYYEATVVLNIHVVIYDTVTSCISVQQETLILHIGSIRTVRINHCLFRTC
jgi:hypothetical protein